MNILSRLAGRTKRVPYPSIQQKVVIITGASAGIGAATARAFAAAGARVALVARRADRLAALAAELQSQGMDVLCIPADITQDHDIDCLAAAVVQAWGRIDILVNNAGVARGGSILEMDPATIHQIIDTNLYGTIRVTQAVLPYMPAGGHIVNVSSVAGEVRSPGQSIYGTSKAAVNAFSDIMRRELADRAISVTTFMPGWTRTHMIGGTDLDALRQIGLYNRWFVVDEPETVAQKIVCAVEHRQRRVIMGGLGFQTGALVGRLSPALMDIHYALFQNNQGLIETMKEVLQ